MCQRLLCSFTSLTGILDRSQAYNSKQSFGIRERESTHVQVLHDTGADIMAIPLPQFEEIENLGKKATLYGYSKMHVAGGTTFYAKVVELELTVLIPYKSGKVLCPWLKAPVAVVEEQPGASFPTSMLSGPFPRFSFYTATCPDGLGLLYLSWYKDELDGLTELSPGYHIDAPPLGEILPPSPGGGPPREPLIGVRSSRLASFSTKQPIKRPAKRGRRRARGRAR